MPSLTLGGAHACNNITLPLCSIGSSEVELHDSLLTSISSRESSDYVITYPLLAPDLYLLRLRDSKVLLRPAFMHYIYTEASIFGFRCLEQLFFGDYCLIMPELLAEELDL